MINSTPTDTTDELGEVFQELPAEELAEIKRKSISGAASYFLRTILLNLIGLVTIIILSGYLTPDDFGIFGYVSQFVGLFVFFSDVGLAAALIQRKLEPTRREYVTAFTVQQALSWLIVLAFMVLSASGIVQQKTGPVGTWLLVALALSFPLSSLKTIPSIMLERKLDFSKLVIPQIFEQLVYNGVLIFFALNHVGVQSYTYAIIARSLIGVVVMMWIKPWMPGIGIDRSALKSLFGYGVKFQLNDLIARIKDQFFMIVLARWLPLNQFGYISWAKGWSMYPYNLTVQNVMAITFPTFSRLQKHKEALGKAIDKSLFFITLAIFPILVGMSAFIMPILALIPRYQKWQPAMISLILFSLSIAWSAISTPLTNTLNAIGQINTTLKLMVMWTVLTWVLTPLAMLFFGFNGVAIAAFVISFTSVLPLWEVKKTIPVHLIQNTWRQFFASIIMAIVAVAGLQLWSRSLIWLAIGCGVAGLTYVLAFLAVGWRELQNEVRKLRQR